MGRCGGAGLEDVYIGTMVYLRNPVGHILHSPQGYLLRQLVGNLLTNHLQGFCSQLGCHSVRAAGQLLQWLHCINLMEHLQHGRQGQSSHLQGTCNMAIKARSYRTPASLWNTCNMAIEVRVYGIPATWPSRLEFMEYLQHDHQG